MPTHGIAGRLLWWLMAFLAISAVYLYTFPQANIPYAGVVLLHTLVGVVATILLLPSLVRLLRTGSLASRAGWLLIVVGAVVGLVLIKTGTSRGEWNKLYVHIVVSVAGVGLLIAGWLSNRANETAGSRLNLGARIVRVVLCLAVLAGVGFGARYIRESWQTRNRIQNPTMPPASMNSEGDGPEGSFFPSSAQVYGKQKIPSKFFMESDSCK